MEYTTTGAPAFTHDDYVAIEALVDFLKQNQPADDDFWWAINDHVDLHYCEDYNSISVYYRDPEVSMVDMTNYISIKINQYQD